MMKSCRVCGAELLLGENWLESAARRSDYSCRSCRNEQSRKWKETNPEKTAEIQRNSKMKAMYGITAGEYDTMYSEQGGRCAICGTHSTEFNRRLAVDHCHTTGKVRALLCTNCNTAIGKLNDDIDLFHKAINYLEMYSED